MKMITEFISGKKTYITAAAAGILAVVQVLHPEFAVPFWVWPILGALGLGFLRAGVAKSK